MKGLSRYRTRRAWIAAASLPLLLATAVTFAATPLPRSWRYWRYSRPIELPATEAKRLASVVVPQDVYPKAQVWLHDIRLIDDTGAEVPYLRYSREGSVASVPIPTALLENSFAQGLYTQVVLELAARAPFHNSVRIATSETDFIEWVSIEASDDGHLWRMVQERAPIFRFEKEGREGTQLVRYSENNARYLRIHILDGERRFPVSGANVLRKTTVPPERVPIIAHLVPDPSTPANETVWRADLGTPALSVREVRFAVGPAEFSRNVDILTSEDGVDWSPFARGQIYRFHLGDAVEEQLTVPVASDTDRRHWRVAVLNGNDAPLPDIAPTLYMTPCHVVFEQQPGRTYRLLYGQSEAKPPRYDLGQRVTAEQQAAAAAGQVGPEEVNSAYADPRPWTEKHDLFLWIVLGIAIAVLAYSAMRSLRRSASSPASNS